LPTGLMLMGHHRKDAQLLAIACGVEALLKKQAG
jgi:Asp-tRNA(Asn)/Glu-tRNA(Gln) amidotransferase A subunit family amidase